MASDLGWLLSGSALLLSVACGQEPVDRVLEPAPPAAMIAADALREGTWVYGDVGRNGEIRGTKALRLSRDGAGRGWLAVSSWRDDRRTLADSLHLAADGVSPTRRVLRRTLDGREIRHITMTYGGDSVEVDRQYPGYPAYRNRWSTSLPRHATPVISPGFGPGYGFAYLVRLLPLDAGWTGAVYVAPLPSGRYRPTILRVVDDERVTVPAGTFDCWRVTVEHDGMVWLTLWVGQASRQLVKAAFSTHPEGSQPPFETVLISSEAAEG